MVRCQKWKPVVVILIIYFVMAVLNLLFKKILDEGKSHLVIVTYRLTTAAIFLMPIAYFRERRRGLNVKLTTPILCYLFISALIGATLTQYLFLLGIQCTSAAFATAFSNMTPVFTFLLAVLLGQESVNFKSTGKIAKVLGSIICIGGVLLMILYRGIPLNKATHSRTSLYNANNLSMFGKIDDKHRWILGSIFLVLSILCWSGWFLIQSSIGKRYPCKYTSTALMSAFGAVQSAILCFAINRNMSVWIFTGKLQILTVLAAVILNILLKKILDEGTNQLVIITYRLTSASIFLAPIAYFCERQSGVKLTTSILCYTFFSALIGATLTQYLFLLGTQYTSAVFASAFANMSPVFTFLLALPLGQEKVNLRSKYGIAKVLGSLTCIGGAILLILYRGIPLSTYHAKHLSTPSKSGSKEKWILGSIFLLSSAVCWSGWFLIQSKIGKKYPFKYSSTALMSSFGAVQSAILCFAINRDITIWILRGKLQIFTVLFAGISGSGLCYVGMSWCVEQKGPVFTAAFSPFIPIFVTIMDFAFFHEQIYLGSVIGSIMVICGLYMLLWGKSNEVQHNVNRPAEAVECHGNSATALNTIRVSSNSECHL
uniref:EamA domain-containing protein n=1 Tax=Chenopodium quinoa TaxID=63459 RepID=A0A803KZW8_CHEQI